MRLSRFVCALAGAALLAACGGANSFPSPRSQPASGSAGFHWARTAASSETVLYRFAGGSDGAVPANDELLAVNGAFYGVTRSGGGSGCSGGGCGTVFKITPSGVETVLHRFGDGADGRYPKGGLVERQGVFYGTTQGGGNNGGGTFFKMTSSGKTTVLHNFGGVRGTGHDGSNPYGKLIYVSATDAFYGTTLGGGTSGCQCGTVFSATPAGKETLLHSFAGPPDGNFPIGGLVYINGYLYGTSQLGGKGNGSICSGSTGVVGCGTVFRVSTLGKEKILYSFTGGSDSAFPAAGFIDVNGTLYGTTGAGFTSSGCDPDCGSVFSISTSGAYHLIHTFAGAPNDGATPFENLTDVQGVLYGATEYGGSGTACPPLSGVTGCGTLFRVTTSGKERVLYSFQGSPDGELAQTALVHTGGVFYGTTDFGGSGCASAGCGVVFSFKP